MKLTLPLLAAVLLPLQLYSQAIPGFFKAFLEASNVLIQTPMRAHNQLIELSPDGTEVKRTEATSFFKGFSQMISFDDSYVLSTPQGYWFMNSKTKSPLKVSGTYKVDHFQVQDILRIDFQRDYTIAEVVGTDTIVLERNSRKMAYPYIRMHSPEDNVYEAYFLDRNKTPLKKFSYHAATVDGIHCIPFIIVQDLAFTSSPIFHYKTLSLHPHRLPTALFTPLQMPNLIQFIQQGE